MTKVRIVSPAKVIEKEFIDDAIKFLKEHSFEVEVSDNCLGQNHYFSGTDKERKLDFQNAIDDSSIDVILCARGGYGCIRIVDDLDFTKFMNKPKLIVGFSDVTVFHNHIHSNLNIPTLHATMPLNFGSNSVKSLTSLVDVMNGNSICYELESHSSNKPGEVRAEVVGGNLAILYALIGTNSDINFDHKILFIEDVGEHIYAIDRMLWAFQKADKLKKLAGLIVGGLTSIKDTEIPFGKTIEAVVLERVDGLDIPVCFNFPAGHIDDNRAIILGKKAVLEVRQDRVKFMQ